MPPPCPRPCGCPGRKRPEGGLALEGWHLLRARLSRADAVLCGSGIGREAETLQLVKDLVAQVELPLVLDADALSPRWPRPLPTVRRGGRGDPDPAHGRVYALGRT